MAKLNLPNFDGWINAKVKKPKGGQYVLVFCPDWCEAEYDIATYNQYTKTQYWENSAEQDMGEDVLFWKPLPKKPINH